MMLRRFALASTSTVWTSAALLVLALVGVGISTANPETVVTQHFTAALEQAPAARRAAPGAEQPLVSGSEAYWLAERRRHEADGAALEAVTWAPPLAAGVAVGDRITISSGSTERVLLVVAISDVEAAPAAGASNGSPNAQPRQVAVTCRDINATDGRLVTFLVPAPMATAEGGRPARAL